MATRSELPPLGARRPRSRRGPSSRATCRSQARTRTSDPGGHVKLYLVSCVSEKRSAPSAARDLYVSSLFRKARAFVEAQHAPWFILSAEHGLVHPDTVIAPYDRT